MLENNGTRRTIDRLTEERDYYRDKAVKLLGAAKRDGVYMGVIGGMIFAVVVLVIKYVVFS